MSGHLYANTTLAAGKARLNPGGPYGPFAIVPLGEGFDVTTHNPAEFDAIAAEFTRGAALLREALAAQAELAGSAVTR
jgi:hypothetical protein